MKEAFYIVDGLTELRANAIKRALLTNDEILGVYINVNASLVKIHYHRTDAEQTLETVCKMIKGVSFRTRIPKRKAKKLI